MTDLLELSELEDDLVPEILPASASLSLTASVEDLKALFSRATGVTPTKEIVPGTGYALLEAVPPSAGTVAFSRITASDGEQTVSVVGIARVKVPGSVLLPPKRVMDILKLAPTSQVDLTVVGPTALIRSGRARWTVAVPVGEFTTVSSLADLSSLEMAPVPAQPFLRALTAARKAASTTNARVSLMQVQIRDSSITACDGGRLHRAPVEGLDPSINTTVPVKVVDELIRTLADEETMFMGFNDQNLVFRVGEDSIVAQRMLLPFPDVSSLLLEPRLTNTETLTVDRSELEAAIKRVRVNADPDVSVVSLNILRGARSENDWMVEVKSRDRSGNTAMDAVECGWSGKPRQVAYNHHHLTDLLSVCESELITMKLGVDTKTSKTPLMVEDHDSGVVGIVQQVTQHWMM